MPETNNIHNDSPSTPLKILYGVFLLALLCIPLTVSGWTDQQEDKIFLIRTIGPLLAVILVLYLSGRNFRYGPIPPLPVLAFGLIVAQLFSLVDVINIGFALASITKLLGFVSFFLIARYFARFPAYRNGMMLVFIIVGIATSIYGIAQHFGYDYIDWQTHEEVPTSRGTSFMGHATFAASVLILLLPLSVVLFINTRNLVIRAICVLAFGLMLYHLSFTAARVATMALVLATCAGAVALFLNRSATDSRAVATKWIAITGGIVLIIGAALVTRTWQAKGSDPLGLLEGGMAQRLFAWDTANRMFITHPVNGVGAGNYEIASPPFWTEAEQVRFARYRRAMYQPHNEYLEAAAETGVPGIFCLLGLVSIALAQAWSGIRRNPTLYGGLFIALVATSLDAFFLFPWQIPDSGLIFWIVLGLIDGSNPKIPDEYGEALPEAEPAQA